MFAANRVAAARGLALLLGRGAGARAPPKTALQSVPSRSSGAWSYREKPAPPPKRDFYIATSFGALMWWWVFYHIITEPGHLIGEWPIIEPSEWSDEELGVPPDSAGPAPRIPRTPVPEENWKWSDLLTR